MSGLMFWSLMRMLEEEEEMERYQEFDSESEEDQDDASSVSSVARADSPISNDNTVLSLTADTETEAEEDIFEFDSDSTELMFPGGEETSSSLSSTSTIYDPGFDEQADAFETRARATLLEDDSWDAEVEYEPVSPAQLEQADAPEVGAHVTVPADTPNMIAVRSPSISPRRQRARKRRATSEDVEAASCAICLDAWSGAGEHAAVALPCGHVFGHGCVRRWLRAKYRCPTCKVTCSPDSVVRLRPALVTSPAAVDLRRRLQEARDQLTERTHDRDRMQGEVAELKKQLNMEENDDVLSGGSTIKDRTVGASSA